ncbi:MAG TPA: aminotransferase class V-fold PLP-dependent enzyme [Propionibacteriaceae bacterium]|nr:aminotransferase class V-fold PLP-dependent enzyme [Propionibacteriaceae bacterium]
MTADAVQQALHNLRQRDLPSPAPRALTGVYDSGLPEADALGRSVIASFAATNGLDPAGYPSWPRMEKDLVLLAARLLDGPAGVVGTATAGGTESIFLAVQAARDSRPDLDRPQLVLPSSAHAAFSQAARYLRVEPVFVDVDPVSCRADAVAMGRAITDQTVLVVASAPSFAHGVVDPVTEIAAAAAARGVRCHVDANLGGWLLPYLRRRRPELPAFSFAVPGVTSISVDLHAYAYTPKTLGLLLHRDAELRRPQFFATAAGPAFPTVASTFHGTRSGGPLAAAWAVTRFIGDHGYLRLADTVRTGVEALLDGLAAVPALRVLAEPDASVVAVAGDEGCDVFTLSDEMSGRGWRAQPQLSWGGFPATLHLVLSAATAPRVPELLDALRASVKAARAAGAPRLAPEVVTAVRTIDLRRFDDDAFDALVESAGLEAGGSMAVAGRLAPAYALLDAATPAVRQVLLTAFADRQSQPRR